jgi:hypothetical protein
VALPFDTLPTKEKLAADRAGKQFAVDGFPYGTR